MSLPQSTVRSSGSRKTTPESVERGSSAFVIAGGILVLLALALFSYAIMYRPHAVDYSENGKLVEYVPPTVGPGSSSTPVSASENTSVSTVKPEQKIQQRPKEKRNHLGPDRTSQKLQPHHETASAPGTGGSRTTPLVVRLSNQSTGSRCAPVEEKVGFFRRVIRAIKELFRDRKPTKTNQPPSASLAASTSTITLPCAPGTRSNSGACPTNASGSVQLITTANDPDGDPLLYSYTVTGGRVTGEDAKVRWDLSGVGPGTYTASVEVNDGRGCATTTSTTVTIANCSDCGEPLLCSKIKEISCPDAVGEGEFASFTANVERDPMETPTYNWTVSAGRISSGQGTRAITVDTTGLGGQTITATLELGGVNPSCPRTSSCSVPVKAAVRPPNTSFDIKIVDPVTRQPLSGVTLIVFGPNNRALLVTTVGVGIFRVPFEGYGDYQVEAIRGSWEIRKIVRLDGSAPASSFTIPFSGATKVVGAGAGADEPTSSVEATPSPTAPTETTTPSASDKIKKRDQIKASYPNYFEKDITSNVAFELERVATEVITHQTNINGGIELVDRPPRDPNAPINSTLATGRGDAYTAYATVRLITKGLSAVEEPTTIEQSLEPEHVAWNFRVKPDATQEEVSFKFHVEIVWKSKEPGRPDHPDKFAFEWPTKVSAIVVPIGAPGYVAGMKYGAAPLGAAGVVALGVGRRKRRKKIDGSDEEDEVTTSVFAPTEATPGGSFLVQVFAHLEAQAPFLEQMAKASDEDARLRFADQLEKTIKRGARLSFQLIMPGLEIDEEVQHRAWDGKPLPIQFGVTVPMAFEPKDVVAKVIICEESVPIGHLRFKIKIVAGAAASVPANAAVDAGRMSRYHRAFISYASEDRSEVAKRVQAFNLLGLTIFFDFLSIEPGQPWEPEIYQHIDQCDVFFLFWSKAASNSEWVHKEILYALKRKAASEEKPPEILPVIIERPAAQPPQELSSLQFNDKFMWFITPPKGPADDAAG